MKRFAGMFYVFAVTFLIVYLANAWKSVDCSQFCGCARDAGCTCVAAHDKCECTTCSCQAQKGCCKQ